MFLGSLLPPILWGVAIANFMVGIPIDETKNAVGGFLQLLHPFALLGGVMFLLLCIVHGLQFLTIRTTGKLRERARIAALKIAPLAIAAIFAIIVMYDASGVRLAVSKQAKILNEFFHGRQTEYKKLNELVGHTPYEVVVGALLGIIVGVGYCL
ncbi:cytochrome d ubiquinol oxidase subunit II [Bacillus sp. B-TM1]